MMTKNIVTEWARNLRNLQSAEREIQSEFVDEFLGSMALLDPARPAFAAKELRAAVAKRDQRTAENIARVRDAIKV
jgi:hypothetical protein